MAIYCLLSRIKIMHVYAHVCYSPALNKMLKTTVLKETKIQQKINK